jgi:chromate transporter
MPSLPREPAAHGIPFREAVRAWVRIGLHSFGGPAGQIAVMHRVLVEERRWISERRFLHALNYCMLLPGPEAQQLTVYVGWLLHKVRGGLVAGTLFVLPGFLSVLALSVLYAGYRELSLVEGLFFGIKPAVLAVVIEAVIRIGRRALTGPALVGLAGFAFVSLFVFEVPFPAVVVGSGMIGLIGGRVAPELFRPRRRAPGRTRCWTNRCRSTRGPRSRAHCACWRSASRFGSGRSPCSRGRSGPRTCSSSRACSSARPRS